MDSTLASLTTWMPRQRWYSASATPPRLRSLAVHGLPAEDPGVRVQVHVVADDATSPATVYQVPLVERVETSAADAEHVVGEGDGTILVDGPHDPAYQAAILALLLPGTAARATVFAGGQSNTSVVFAPPGAPPAVATLFRRLQPGINPDVELQTALTAAGSPHVPRAMAQHDLAWDDPDRRGATQRGTALFLQEFLPDVEDAWRVALVAAAAGESFTAPAHALGVATAEVHLDLARLLPVAEPGDAERAGIRAAWVRRLDVAMREVPELAPHRHAIEDVYARTDGIRWPPLQRIHGDLHLGQVLQVPGRGWVLLDFEGEPMRPIVERRHPDAAPRDIAGMLRSFDYVAGALPEAPHAAEWAVAARRAFLGGYEDRTGVPATGPLLDAFELDKAVDETVHETRSRPGWLGIPLAAVARLARR